MSCRLGMTKKKGKVTMKLVLFGIALELFAVVNLLMCGLWGRTGEFTPLCLGIAITAALVGLLAALFGTLKD